MIIYIDILLLVNLYISYLLIASTSKVLAIAISKPRFIIALVISTFSSLIILFEFSVVELLLVKVLLLFAICVTAFYNKNKKQFIVAIFTFIVISGLYGGVIMLIHNLISPQIMQYNNGVAYFDISAITLILLTIICYIVTHYITLWINQKAPSTLIYDITLQTDLGVEKFRAFMDTGNRLVDSFSGLPVIVCECDSMQRIIGEDVVKLVRGEINNVEEIMLKHSLRYVPVSVVGGDDLLYCIVPKKVRIKINGENVDKKAVVALSPTKLSDDEFECLMGSRLVC